MSDEWVLVPREPVDAQLTSMALTYDHGYGLRNAFERENIRLHMAQLHRAMLEAAPAAPQQAEPVAWMDKGETGGKGQTKVRVASTETLSGMPEIARRAYVVPLYLHPPVAPQQAEPVAQIGWADEFGNLFPMGAWKPEQRTHHDSHKAAWRPVFPCFSRSDW